MRIAVLAALLLASTALAGAPLDIANKTNQEIINILAKAKASEFYFRLDLAPGASDEVENPGVKATLRADTGLEFWTFADVDLAGAKRLVFCPEHAICLVVEEKSGKSLHIDGKAQQLVPGAGAKPVCNLDRFHPAMPMKEVCDILPGQMPRDDNGALITGMGFGGLLWAARLVPAQNGPVTQNTLLEHLELRRPLTKADARAVTDALYAEGYVPWQAEFPGLDMEFADEATPAERKKLLLANVERFLEAQAARGHRDHARQEKCEEASIIMAPAKMLPALENADEPTRDVQIFTIFLRPCARTLLLDVAAYRGNMQ